MSELPCETCGTLFAPYRNRKKFCSVSCQRRAFYLRHHEALKEKQRQWNAANGEYARKWAMDYYWSHTEERNEYHRAYVAANKDRMKISWRQYAQANRERIAANHKAKFQDPEWVAAFREKQREYYRRMRDQILQKKRQEYITKTELIKERRQQYRLKNKDRVREQMRRWYSANREIVKAFNVLRKVRLKNCSGTHTAEEIKDLFARQRGKCAACSTRLSSNYHVDHIMPLARGGSNSIENIQLLCPPCNLSKGAKDPYEWAQKKRGRLF
jgi:5-methylcytosine-specific restriction endonuclease McrA